VYYNLGQYEKALSYYEEALKIRREIGDVKGEGGCLNNIGIVYRNLGQYEKALSYYEDSLEIFREIGDVKGEGTVLNNIGIVYRNLGRYEQALSYNEEALKISREIGDVEGEGRTLNSIGAVYDYLGQYEKALSCYEESLEINREIGNVAREGGCLNNIGVVYRNLGQYEKALSYYEDSLEIFREIGEVKGEELTLNNIGIVYWSLGQYEKALSQYEESLKIQREIGDVEGEGATLSNIGIVYLEKGQFEEALSQYEESLKIQREIGDVEGEGATLENVGTVYWNLGKYERALSAYEEALKIQREIGDLDGIYGSSWGMGNSYRNLKKYTEAIDSYIMAIDTLEQIRGDITTEEYKTSFMENKMEVYEELIELLMEMEREEEAYDYMERARSRAFLDMLATRSFALEGEMDEELLERERVLQGRISALRERAVEENAAGDDGNREVIASVTAEIEKAEAEYAALIKEMQAKSPELSSLVTVNPLTLSDVQSLLPADVRIIEYFTTENALFIFSVGKDDFTVYTVDIGKDELSEKISDFRYQIHVPASMLMGDYSELQAHANGLYNLLIAPFIDDVHEETLIIIPYGTLHYLPFSALYDGNEYLVDTHTLIVDPSASVLEYVLDKRKDVSGGLLALGNPTSPETKDFPLPYAEEEVKLIGEIMGDADIYLNENATETLGRERSSDYAVFHLSCHGSFNETDPLLSALYLADDAENDGKLMVHELFGLDLSKSSLVVLSACVTGLSDVTRGDELIGLSRGFMYAGTPSLVVTLWSVEDRSAADLMVRFYENINDGMEKPEALREAQLWLKSREEYAHPFYWAPFEMIGDWE